MIDFDSVNSSLKGNFDIILKKIAMINQYINHIYNLKYS